MKEFEKSNLRAMDSEKNPEINYSIPASYCGRFDNEPSSPPYRRFIPGYSFYMNLINLKDHEELYVILRGVEDLIRDIESTLTSPNNDVVDKQRRSDGFRYGIPNNKKFIDTEIKRYLKIMKSEKTSIRDLSDRLDEIVDPYTIEILHHLKMIRRMFNSVNCGDNITLCSSIRFDESILKQFLEEKRLENIEKIIKSIEEDYTSKLYDFQTQGGQICGKKTFRHMFGVMIVRYDTIIQSSATLLQKFVCAMKAIPTEESELGETYRKVLTELSENQKDE